MSLPLDNGIRVLSRLRDVAGLDMEALNELTGDEPVNGLRFDRSGILHSRSSRTA